MTASVTGDVAEESLYSQACCGPKLYLVAKVWYEGGESGAYGKGAETISRILQNCLSATHMRIRRLDMVIDVVKKRPWKEGHVVLNKPRVVAHEKDQLLRPGLCAKKDGKALVLDAHVPYETSAKRQPSPELIRSRNMHHTATASGDIILECSLRIAWILGKNKKPFTDSEIVEECMLETVETLFDDKIKSEINEKINELPLSDSTSMRRTQSY